MATTSGSATTTSPKPSTTGSVSRPGKGPGKGQKGMISAHVTSGDSVPVWMDVDTAKFLIRSLTAALNQNIVSKKKK
jgi:hypothetical protein